MALVGFNEGFTGSADLGAYEHGVAIPIYGVGGSIDTSSDAPAVGSVELNTGELQRSAVESITAFFAGEVDLAVGAVTVVQRSTQTDETFETVATSVSRQFSNNETTVTIQFDSHVRNSDNALVDGNYQLTLTANLVTKAGIPMSEDFVFGDVEADQFYSFYSDSDGNRISNIFDLLAFRQSFGTVAGSPRYEHYLDFEANGSINIFDLLALRTRFLTSLPFEFGSNRKSSNGGLSGRLR